MTRQTLVDSAAGDDPGTGLRAARSLRELADRLEALQVARARERGWSWQEVGSHPASSPQEAWQEELMITWSRRVSSAAMVRAASPGMR